MTRRPQAGFSLIELMVAITLGLLVLFGILQIYLSNSDNAAFNFAQQQNQGNARLILGRLDQEASHAGYSAWQESSTQLETGGETLYDFRIDRDLPFPEQTEKTTGCVFAEGEVAVIDSNGKGLCLRYQRAQVSDAQYRLDCTGGTLYADDSDDTGSPETLVSHLYLSGRQLLCKTNNALSEGALPIASGIHDLRFEKSAANRIRVGLVLSSERQLLPANCDYQDPLDAASQKSTGNRGLCAAFGQTLYLRNIP